MDIVKEERLQVEETAALNRLQFTEIVPLARHTDGSCTTECVSRDWSAEAKWENLAVVNSATNALKEEHSPLEETDDPCRFEVIEILPHVRDNDGSCTSECVSGDWSAEVKPENFAVVKQEPDDVCCIASVILLVMCSICQSRKQFLQMTLDNRSGFWNYFSSVLLAVAMLHM